MSRVFNEMVEFNEESELNSYYDTLGDYEIPNDEQYEAWVAEHMKEAESLYVEDNDFNSEESGSWY